MFANGKGQSWQCDEGVACTALEPRITSKQITLVVLGTIVELMGGIDKTVEEVVAWVSLRHLLPSGENRERQAYTVG